MAGHRDLVKAVCAFVVLTIASRPEPIAWAADKEKPKSVSGILMEKRDKWLEVKGDGDEEAVKYAYDGTDKKLAAALKPIFTVSRVRLTYQLASDGESRQLVSIIKLRPIPAGTVTGEVLAVHNNFWVEVKPKGRPPDGYALNGPPDKFKAVVETLKGLKKGDVVTLRYTTDFERHRIVTLKKIKDAPQK